MVTMAIEEKRLRAQLAELDLMAEHVEQLTDTLRMINVNHTGDRAASKSGPKRALEWKSSLQSRPHARLDHFDGSRR